MRNHSEKLASILKKEETYTQKNYLKEKDPTKKKR